MRFKRHLKLEHGLKEIDIAPSLNVLFLLLIFFILTSSFITQPGTKFGLPKMVTSASLKPGSTELIISAENIVYLNGKTINERDLKNLFLRIASKNEPVLIKADKKASLNKVVEICDLARDSGLMGINIAANQ